MLAMKGINTDVKGRINPRHKGRGCSSNLAQKCVAGQPLKQAVRTRHPGDRPLTIVKLQSPMSLRKVSREGESQDTKAEATPAN